MLGGDSVKKISRKSIKDTSIAIMVLSSVCLVGLNFFTLKTPIFILLVIFFISIVTFLVAILFDFKQGCNVIKNYKIKIKIK